MQPQRRAVIKLKKLALQNFRGLENLEFAFHDRLAVVAGANGCGKTAMLEGVAMALSAFVSKLAGAGDPDNSGKTARLAAYPATVACDTSAPASASISIEAEIDGRR
ncbi:MAG: AAA family ATPase [Succinivibrionaceae bacterium]|nr:AAA family ATPase [Succinivibrionaceae bacterium]